MAYIPGGRMSHQALQIELLDQGMIVSYDAPVRRTRMQGGRPMDPMTEAMIGMIPQIMQSLPGQEDENWDERKANRMDMIQNMAKRAMEAMKPKPVEEWVWQRCRVVVADEKGLMAAIETARKMQVEAKKIEQGGEHIHHPYDRSYGSVDFITARPMVAPMPPPDTDVFEAFGEVGPA